MAEPGLYALTKIIAGGLSATLTGPLGTTDLPEVDLNQALGNTRPAHMAEISASDGQTLGWTGFPRTGSPGIDDLPDYFIAAVLAIEDHRYGLHPGVDPIAILSAGIDTIKGNPRGGSTLTQQLIKNTITGPAPTLDRKIQEAILAVRTQSAWSSREILHAYLSNVWFGRGARGAASASLAWFGKPWDQIRMHEAAYLAGLLNGPARHDPEHHPGRGIARRNLVISRMHDHDIITAIDKSVAMSLPLDVIPEREARALLDDMPGWISSGITADLDRYGLMNRSDIASGTLGISTTISPDWQRIAEQSLADTIDHLVPKGPVIQVDLPEISHGDSLAGNRMTALRKTAAEAMATSSTTGRAMIAGITNDKVSGITNDKISGISNNRVSGTTNDSKPDTTNNRISDITKNRISVIIDRGYGPLEWDFAELNPDFPDYTPVRGDVLPFSRDNGKIILSPVPQVQGAVVVMTPETGAILASVGGHDATLFPFDRTEALRQPGSAIKPFLWARALEDGLFHDTLVADVEQSYILSNGQVWQPVNYDHRQSGMIPLFVGLEESSNLVAAELVDLIGVPALASITEFAGIYDWGSMRRHRSSALGTSETTLTRLTAGYAAFANGGRVITPHRIAGISRKNRTLWTPPDAENIYAMTGPETLEDTISMLYGVTRRGTAASAFRGFDLAVAGKTGTNENYRDAWFVSFTPGVVIGVWIGRDDFMPIPGHPTGSRAAAPVAREIYRAALDTGLLQPNGLRPGHASQINWPPVLLEVGHGHRNYHSPQVQQIPQVPQVPREPRETQIPEVSQTPEVQAQTAQAEQAAQTQKIQVQEILDTLKSSEDHQYTQESQHTQHIDNHQYTDNHQHTEIVVQKTEEHSTRDIRPVKGLAAILDVIHPGRNSRDRHDRRQPKILSAARQEPGLDINPPVLPNIPRSSDTGLIFMTPW